MIIDLIIIVKLIFVNNKDPLVSSHKGCIKGGRDAHRKNPFGRVNWNSTPSVFFCPRKGRLPWWPIFVHWLRPVHNIRASERSIIYLRRVATGSAYKMIWTHVTYVATRVQIILYALPVATLTQAYIVNRPLVYHRVQLTRVRCTTGYTTDSCECTTGYNSSAWVYHGVQLTHVCALEVHGICIPGGAFEVRCDIYLNTLLINLVLC